MNKHFRYGKYLARHKWFVFIAGLRTKAPLWRLLVHDWSKFLPSEWIPYADYFYGPKPDKNEPDDFRYWLAVDTKQARFDGAWLHHQHANPHHWQHWMLREDSGVVKLMQIPEHFVREMVADWMGAGRAITGRWEAAEWYVKNYKVIQLNPVSRERVHELLNIKPPSEFPA